MFFVFIILISTLFNLHIVKASTPEFYSVSKAMLSKFDPECAPLTNILTAASKEESPWHDIIKQKDGDNGFLINRELLLEKINFFKERFARLNEAFPTIDTLFSKKLNINNKEDKVLIYQQFEFLQNYLIPVMIDDEHFYKYLKNLDNKPLFYYLNRTNIISLEKQQNKKLRISNEQIQLKDRLILVMFCLGLFGSCYVNRTTIAHFIN